MSLFQSVSDDTISDAELQKNAKIIAETLIHTLNEEETISFFKTVINKFKFLKIFLDHYEGKLPSQIVTDAKSKSAIELLLKSKKVTIDLNCVDRIVSAYKDLFYLIDIETSVLEEAFEYFSEGGYWSNLIFLTMHTEVTPSVVSYPYSTEMLCIQYRESQKKVKELEVKVKELETKVDCLTQDLEESKARPDGEYYYRAKFEFETLNKIT